jgi:hypothetical protein
MEKKENQDILFKDYSLKLQKQSEIHDFYRKIENVAFNQIIMFF